MIRIWFEQFAQDLRFAVRNLRNAPGFAASAILSLALGMGATTAIYSVIHGVIIDPFPYSHPETLYSFYATVPDQNFFYSPQSPDAYLEIQERTNVFSGLIASTISDVSLTGTGEPERLRGNFCTVNTFQVMGVAPLIGRYIVPDDGKPEANPVTVLGYKFWKKHFNGDPGVIGHQMRLNDKVRTVVGVMPKRFMWRGADVYLPVVFQRGRFVEDVHWPFIMGRLKPGVTLAEATTQLHPVFQDLILRESGKAEPKLRVVLQNFYETFPSGIRKSLWILFGAVGVLLLIACANVSSLLLARSAARNREMAIRISLGAGKLRIIRQLLTESAIIGLAAGCLGILLALVSLHSILAIVPPNTIPDESEVTLNLPVLLFTLLVSLAAAFLFGLAPAFQAGRTQMASALKGSGRGISGAFGETRVRNIFVIAEVALAMMLLFGACLVIRTLLQVERVQVGTQPENVLTMSIPLSDRRYPTREARNNFYRQFLDRVQQIPGLTRVGLNQSIHPFVFFVTTALAPGSPVKSKTRIVVSQISSGYPEFMNIHLLQGRLLSEADVRGGRHLAVVNSKFASYFFPKGDAVGQSVQLLQIHPPPSTVSETCEIIGVVSDVPNMGLTRQIFPEAYIPFTIAGYQELSTTVLAKGVVPARSLVKPLERQVHALDPDQPVMNIYTLREWLDLNGYSEPKFSVFLFGVFAGVGLLLAALGIYAVVNYSVLRQTQEIGVRMALGARPVGIVGMVLRSGGKLLGIGALLGIVGSLSVTQLLRSIIWGVSAADPISLVAVLFALSIIGLLACVRPALRAANIDPMTALRYE